MRRLFSSFAAGWPGAGLLFMRMVAASASTGHAVSSLRAGVTMGPAALHVLAIADAVLLVAGLWTPVAGLLLASLELSSLFSHPADPLGKILLATLGVALVLLGPGAWSIDARLYGWKRIELTNSREPDVKNKNRQRSR